MASSFYGSVLNQVVPVGSPRTAEMVKLLENTFRMINIGLVNELAMICDRIDLDVWEIISAAATKPFGFMPFHPGPGLGGHCIPVDPHYLSWKTRQFGRSARFIELASEINSSMPMFVFRKIQDALNSVNKSVNRARVHIVGVAYKKNVSDVRESPALDIIELLRRNGAVVTFSDSFVSKVQTSSVRLQAQPLEKAYDADCVAILTDHSDVDYAALVERSALIFDARNATKGLQSENLKRL